MKVKTAANNLLAAAIDARMLHEHAQADDDKLAKALCKDGQFALSHRKRMEKLGISAEKLADLSPADKRRLFRLDIVPDSITWQRVMDTNDRLLRRAQIGLGEEERNGNERVTGFDISVASEVRAILGLTTGWRTCASDWGASSLAPTGRATRSQPRTWAWPAR